LLTISGLFLDAACPRPDQCRNVALHKEVAVSSAMHSGRPDMIVDGHSTASFGANGHCLHFIPEVQPWVKIDLGMQFLIHSVNVTTRGDGYNWGKNLTKLEF
jgi:hypothetical protein